MWKHEIWKDNDWWWGFITTFEGLIKDKEDCGQFYMKFI